MPRKKVKKTTPFKKLIQAWVTPENKKFAKQYGKELFGSTSAYINTLIANDRKVKPVEGHWKSKGKQA